MGAIQGASVPTRDQFDERLRSVDATLKHLSVQCDKPSDHQEGDCGATYSSLRLRSLRDELFSPQGEVKDPNKAKKVFEYLDTLGRWANQTDAVYPLRSRALPLVREINGSPNRSQELGSLVQPLMEVSNISAKTPLEVAIRLESYARGNCSDAPVTQSLRNYRRLEPTLNGAESVFAKAEGLTGHHDEPPVSPSQPSSGDQKANSNTGIYGFFSWLFGW